MLRAMAAGGEGWRPPRLRGSEFASLPRLRHLVLDRVDCPHGDPPLPCVAPLLHLDMKAHVALSALLLCGSDCRQLVNTTGVAWATASDCCVSRCAIRPGS